ncbi:nicotinamidase-related amidase [Agromyces hippuratus]|uniref:Nicotinamidase-related amidase n=1 Tax=Agromyces hippuratus TaxID=286438 RepID=A0A852X8H3_9MICO|nr:cysteine hydrolase family protein [Agromyces hippuratus]NYG22251.1 nicotinamidase-related amidase [Agromyces hippuratus]
MTRTLVIIDIQNDYFEGGAHPLVGPEAAAVNAARLLASHRQDGQPVVHVQHVWDAPDAEFFAPGTHGVEIHPLVAPADGEPVVVKANPNSFLGTDLDARLREARADVDGVVIVGMMSSMCVDATVRAAADAGYSVTVAHDACAAPDLAFGGSVVPAAQVHGAFMAALGDSYAEVVSTDQLLAGR